MPRGVSQTSTIEAPAGTEPSWVTYPEGQRAGILTQPAFLVALGVWLWVRGFTENRPGLYPLFFVATGLATIAKGPAGFLPPLLAIVAFLLITREREQLRRMRIGLGFLIWAGVVLAWLVPAELLVQSDGVGRERTHLVGPIRSEAARRVAAEERRNRVVTLGTEARCSSTASPSWPPRARSCC